jgi:hypothetical protein
MAKGSIEEDLPFVLLCSYMHPTTLEIEQGAHHLDLMWSHEQDPSSVKAARAYELLQVSAWIKEHRMMLATQTL